ncbi:hypothetical protein OG203_06315 [Nocardia sp. NBC_01499]
MRHHDDRVSATDQPTAASEPVHATPTGRLTCEVRVVLADEETK